MSNLVIQRMGGVQLASPLRPTAHRMANGDRFVASESRPLEFQAGMGSSPSADWLTEGRAPCDLTPEEWSALSPVLGRNATPEQAQWLASGLDSERSLVSRDTLVEHRCLALLAEIKERRPEVLEAVKLGERPLVEGLTERLLNDSAPATEMVSFFRQRWLTDACRLIYPQAGERIENNVVEGYRETGNLATMAQPRQKSLALWVTAQEGGLAKGLGPFDRELKAELLRRPREPLYMAVGNLLRDQQGAEKLGIQESLQLGRQVLAGARESDYGEESLDLRHYLYHQLNTADPIGLYHEVEELEARVMPRLKQVSHPQELTRQELAEVQMLGVLREQLKSPRWNEEVDRLFNRDLKGDLLTGARAGLAVTQALYYSDRLSSSELSPREVVRSAQWMFRLSDTIPQWFVESSMERSEKALDRSREPWIRELRERFPDVRQSVEVAAVVIDQTDRGSSAEIEYKDFVEVVKAAEQSDPTRDFELDELMGVYRRVKELDFVLSREEALNQVLGTNRDSEVDLEFDEDTVWVGAIPLDID